MAIQTMTLASVAADLHCPALASGLQTGWGCGLGRGERRRWGWHLPEEDQGEEVVVRGGQHLPEEEQIEGWGSGEELGLLVQQWDQNLHEGEGAEPSRICTGGDMA